jgi:hypothetical protein
MKGRTLKTGKKRFLAFLQLSDFSLYWSSEDEEEVGKSFTIQPHHCWRIQMVLLKGRRNKSHACPSIKEAPSGYWTPE